MAWPSLYPELEEAGGLRKALAQALVELDSEISVAGLEGSHLFTRYAKVEKGMRFSKVYPSIEQRRFVGQFWRDDIHYSDALTTELIELARLIKSWVEDEVSLTELSNNPAVTVKRGAWSWDRGTEIEDRWIGLLETMGNYFPELVDFVNAASEQPQLRQLFPYTGMNRFCFSRCTRYPYTGDTPVVRPVGNTTYEVCLGRDLIGSGDATTAAQIVVANLPDGCGPAVRGTAKTI